MLIFATYSLVRVGRELEVQADRQMQRSARSTALAIEERLSFARHDLRDAGNTVAAAATTREGSCSLTGPANYVFDPDVTSRLAERFDAIKVRDRDGHEHLVMGAPFSGPDLDDADQKRLGTRQCLVRPLDPTSVGSGIALLVPTRDPEILAIGVLSADHLWSRGATASTASVSLCLDQAGNRVFATGDSTSVAAVPVARIGTDPSERFSWRANGGRWIGRYWRQDMTFEYASAWTIVEAAPQAEVLGPARAFRSVFLMTCVISLLLVVILSMHQIHEQLTPIARLKEATRRLASADFDARVSIRTGDEFEELADSFNSMAGDMKRHSEMRRALVDLGIELTAEGNERHLLHVLVGGVRKVLGCEGSGVATLDPNGEVDSFLVQFDGGVQVCSRDRLESLASTDMDERAAIERVLGRPLRSFLSLPLKDHEGGRSGTLYAFDSWEEGESPTESFSLEQAQLGNVLAAQASAALSQSRLVESFKDLFDGMSQMMALAIDEKSPYTYGHCSRVPVAAMMLADAVCRSTDGPYAEFCLSPEERYEFEIAALLHDCGKVATPVHVVDKATKLETIVDRIALVRTRFEVIARDWEIRRLRDVGSMATVEAWQPSGGWHRELQDDFDFLVRCNRGTEFLPTDAQERIREIAGRYQFVERDGQTRSVLDEDEVENLTISRGTLNESERKVIQDHVATSIRMLETLPYPKNLSLVPLIAGAHHERMDGKGYPNGVRLGELPLQARILALADVFEALTAPDRPYKEGKSLSEALRIMASMKMDGHIDPELFDFFLAEGVYLQYAHLHVAAHQIDEVDIASLPGCSHLVPRREAA